MLAPEFLQKMKNSLRASTFYGILDTGYVTPGNWIAKYDALVAGGASLIQLRAKGSTPEQRHQLTEQIVSRRAESRLPQPPLIINNDIELALRFPDLGLHLGEDAPPPEVARKRLGPDRILGMSILSPEQARSALQYLTDILSYFSIGPVFATKTKPNASPTGLEFVRFVADQQPTIPFFCIGGIDRDNIREVVAAGATRIVGVSDVLQAADTAAAVRESIRLIQ